MNIDELRQSLSAIAEEARPDATTPDERIDAVDQLVKDHRRNSVVGAVAAAAVAIAAVAIAPAVLGGSDSTEPAHHTDNGLPAVVERGTAFYTQPAGSTLIGHEVAEPGAREISFTFTPSTLNLSWEQECWDPQLKGLDKGAWYSSYVNGHPLGGSTCQGPASADPLNGTGSFGESPAANENGWQDMGVKVGEPSTFTLRLTQHADRAVDPQLVAGVWERGEQVQTDGVWYDRQLVYKGHSYQVVAAKVAQLDGTRAVTAGVDLPASEHQLYVYQGAQHVTSGLQLHADSSGVTQLGKGVTGGGSGDTVPLDRRTAQVRAHPVNPDAAGQIFVLVYERTD